MSIFKVVRLILILPKSLPKQSGLDFRRWLCQTDQPIPLRPKKPKARTLEFQEFVDYCHVKAIGGKGGDGCISFAQLWSNEKAGPDGGDGGNGGHVIFRASQGIQDLSKVGKTIRAAKGERGFNRDCTGKSAKHEYIKVPIGTVIRNKEGVIVGDLSQEGALFIAARGGAGGRGNHFFVSDTIQAPEVAELGGEGEELNYILEIKTMAHIGMVGMPNAGKSTLLRAISRARPKVAAYPFTTLKPHIGMIHYSDHEQIAIADLPGLVEGSHKNKGLGIEFLKHTERCSTLLFVIDLSSENPIQQYQILRYEISQFSEELYSRPYIVVANKIDLESAQKNLETFKTEIDQPVFFISAKTGKNLNELLGHLRGMYDYAIKRKSETNGSFD